MNIYQITGTERERQRQRHRERDRERERDIFVRRVFRAKGSFIPMAWTACPTTMHFSRLICFPSRSLASLLSMAAGFQWYESPCKQLFLWISSVQSRYNAYLFVRKKKKIFLRSFCDVSAYCYHVGVSQSCAWENLTTPLVWRFARSVF